MDLNRNLDNFCWCCLKVTGDLLCMLSETFQNDGAAVKAVDWWLKCAEIDLGSTPIPIDKNCKICSLCLVSLKISCSFHTMCVQSVQKLEELCRIPQDLDVQIQAEVICENGTQRQEQVGQHSQSGVRKEHRCHICDKAYTFRSQLARHLEAHERYKCLKCDAVFLRLKLLEEHTRAVHETDAAPAMAAIEPLNMLELLYDSDGQDVEEVNPSPETELKISSVQSLALNEGRHQHQLEIQKRRVHRCPICRKTFNFQSVLEQHIASHNRPKYQHNDRNNMRHNNFSEDLSSARANKEGKHCCTLCPKSFNFRSVLMRHISQHEKHKCIHCGQGFTRSSTLEMHVISSHPELQMSLDNSMMSMAFRKEHSCHLCGKSFSFQSVLQKHLSCHDKYKCEFCHLGFTRLSALENHLQDVHQVVQQTINRPSCSMSARKEHRCHLCEKSFLFNSVLARHIARHNKYQCQICNRGFSRASHLEEHVTEDHHGDGNESTTSSGQLRGTHTCKLCDKVFSFRSRLLQHLANHEKYKCMLPHCAIGFTRSKDLEDHLLEVHQIEKLATISDEANSSSSRDGHSCPLCGKKFNYQSILLRHIAQHEKYKCTHCSQGFTKSSHLGRHMAEEHPSEAHSKSMVLEGGVHSHVCHMCGKAFEFPSALKQHLTAHKHNCNFCEKVFTRLSYVDEHVKVDHPSEWVEQPQEVRAENRCELCQKTFEFPSALKQHIAWHNKYKCRHCELTFSKLALLDEHMRDEHPEQWTARSRPNSKSANRCNLCNKVLPFPSALKLHLAWHNKHKCPSCDRGFPTLLLLSDHTKNEHPEVWAAMERPDPKGENRCSICDKVFPFPSALKLHYAWHNKHRCAYCEQAFPTLVLLDGHARTEHPDEYAFNVSNSSIKTEAPEEEDKPLKCQLCPKSFYLTSALRRHMTWHTRNSQPAKETEITIKKEEPDDEEMSFQNEASDEHMDAEEGTDMTRSLDVNME